MLETTCPDCQVPIMRSRQKEEICCVCETEYQNKAEEVVEPAKPPQSHSNVLASALGLPPIRQETEALAAAEPELDSDEEYNKMAKEDEEKRGIKLPPRNKGSNMRMGRGPQRQPLS